MGELRELWQHDNERPWGREVQTLPCLHGVFLTSKWNLQSPNWENLGPRNSKNLDRELKSAIAKSQKPGSTKVNEPGVARCKHFPASTAFLNFDMECAKSFVNWQPRESLTCFKMAPPARSVGGARKLLLKHYNAFSQRLVSAVNISPGQAISAYNRQIGRT